MSKREWIYTVEIKRGYDDPICFEFRNGEEAQAFAMSAAGAHVADTYSDGEIKGFEVSMKFSTYECESEAKSEEDDF